MRFDTCVIFYEIMLNHIVADMNMTIVKEFKAFLDNYKTFYLPSHILFLSNSWQHLTQLFLLEFYAFLAHTPIVSILLVGKDDSD